jgi:hypothetical protein
MATKLSKPLRREVEIEGVLYTVTLAPEGLKITQKGHRKGHELTWQQLVRGNASAAPELEGSMSFGSDNNDVRA